MNIKWYLSDHFACGHIRGELFAREVNKARACRVDCKSDIMISDYYGTDLMVFQRSHNLGIYNKMMLAKKEGIKVVYDIDDDFFNTPKEFEKPYLFYSQPEVMECITKFLCSADAITASTQALANSLRPRAGDTPIFIMENHQDVDTWNGAYAKRGTLKKDTITIGWMASGSHAYDAPIVLPAVKKIMQENSNVHLHLIGWVGWEQLDEEFKAMRSRVHYDEWIDINALPENMIDFDIGIAACKQSPYNEAKSAIKLFQYWSLGIPVVASAISEYMDKIDNGLNGLLADDDLWYEKLKELVDDADKRRHMGAQGRYKVISNYDTKNNVRHWIDTFATICEL